MCCCITFYVLKWINNLTSATRHRVILVLSGIALAKIIWSGRHSNTAICYCIPMPSGSSITTSRLWSLATLVCWYYLVGVAPTRKQDGLLAEINIPLHISLKSKSQNWCINCSTKFVVRLKSWLMLCTKLNICLCLQYIYLHYSHLYSFLGFFGIAIMGPNVL